MLARQLAFFLFLALPTQALAYPNFIGYGYSSCATCHYNVNGNGALTDYGRALSAQEIASRVFAPRKKSDEKLAEQSGFIPGFEIPIAVRPSIKYRGLWFDTAPGSSRSRKRFIHMQRDFNLVAATSDSFRTIVSVTYGLLPETQDYYQTGEVQKWITREHYVRSYISKKVAIAMGLLDKAYGLRHADHTAANRGRIGNGQDDQVHGGLIHFADKSYELTLHAFVGNLFEESSLRQKGGALTFEYVAGQKHRVGTSLMNYKTAFADSYRLALHDRFGLPNSQGSSVIVEAGLIHDKAPGQTKFVLGNYFFGEAIFRIVRGFNLISSLDRSQTESALMSPDTQRWTTGLLIFPASRFETRLTAVQTKTFSPIQAAADRWSIQGQIHASF